ncbi:RNA helicase, DEAD-box type, Q motif [Sesbania bispinosa]|nr:RNA helicase, DEAD-box type, Q motif [Sesbania bispinosa]
MGGTGIGRGGDRELRRHEREKSSDSEDRERDRKRHRKEDDDYKGRERERSASKSNRKTEELEASPRKKSDGDDSDTKDKERKPTREEEMEDEQRRLDEEMEKRRRRVQEWQELRRKKEEAEREKHGEASANEPESGKTWTLEGESDDEEGTGTGKQNTAIDVDGDDKPAAKEPMESMAVDVDNGTVASDLQNGAAGAPADEEIDPLDAFMNSMVLPEVEKLNNAVTSSLSDKAADLKPKDKGDERNEEISKMTPEEAAVYRKQLELKIHGKDVPKPVKSWHQTGLTSKILETIKKLNFEKPMPIQAQALPVIMSGRDCIGIAKTGSGKTLAFVLPMLRHIKDQPPVVAGDGPIGLIMAPTRELVQQIHSDIKKFTKVLGLRCVPVYGGSGVAQQISELKRGTEIVVCTPAQLVEVRPENERFLRLLEILGEWYEKGKILIFVHSQEKCDVLFKDLLRHGYPCLSLHGAKDQTDRESTISDFKSNVCNLLVATSVAARGLDVKELELVINFDVPNHYEDYVHRVGRTGRAGRKGCAITLFLRKMQDMPQICFMAKVNQGLEQAHGTGYGGSGFKFNEEEDEVRKAAKKAQAKEYGFEEDKSDSEDEDEGIRKAGGDISQHPALAQILAATKMNSTAMPTPISAAQLISNGGLPVSLPAVLGLQTATVLPGTGLPLAANDGAARAALAAMNLQHNLAKIQSEALPEHYEAELEINDFPQNARWKVTHKET